MAKLKLRYPANIILWRDIGGNKVPKYECVKTDKMNKDLGNQSQTYIYNCTKVKHRLNNYIELPDFCARIASK